MLKIHSTAERRLNDTDSKKAHAIMRVAYEATEAEIWGKNYTRLFYQDFKALIDKGDIYIAYLDELIVGCIHIYPKDDNTYTFSLLAVDFAFGGKGIGTALIQTAENLAKNNGARYVKMEVLRVKNKEVSHKVKLANYYKILGYINTHSADCKCIIPDWKYKLLIAPSDFDFYEKELE